MYLAGLLFPVQYIGERKGGLTVILAAKFRWGISDAEFETYSRKVSDIAQNLSLDSWHCQFGTFNKALARGVLHQTEYQGLINDNSQKVDTYIRNIDNMWSIRLRSYMPLKRAEYESTMSRPSTF